MVMAHEPEKVAPIYGGPDNPVREPRKTPNVGKGSPGDTALMDAIGIIVVCWAIIFFLMYSLRNYNV